MPALGEVLVVLPEQVAERHLSRPANTLPEAIRNLEERIDTHNKEGEAYYKGQPLDPLEVPYADQQGLFKVVVAWKDKRPLDGQVVLDDPQFDGTEAVALISNGEAVAIVTPRNIRPNQLVFIPNSRPKGVMLMNARLLAENLKRVGLQASY